jgi:hypothetical protein
MYSPYVYFLIVRLPARGTRKFFGMPLKIDTLFKKFTFSFKSAFLDEILNVSSKIFLGISRK